MIRFPSRSLFVITAVVFARPTIAQTSATLSGRITDSQGNAIGGASVRSLETDRIARTEADGRYTVTGLHEGRHEIEIRAVGYASAIRRIHVLSGTSNSLDVTLGERITTLGEVTVREQPAPGSVRQAEDILGTLLTVGAKSEVIEVRQMAGNVAEKTGRQIFSRVPGVFVYDMDGSGNQVNISTRGLDAHRSWEMNARQDGVLTNSDLYGYPASHYSPPMEAIQRVELIRGTAALQYGSQFGGLVNYVTRQPYGDVNAAFANQSTAGSFGLLTTYGSVGGTAGSVGYYVYAQRRHSDGFRDNATSDADAQYGAVTWQLSPTFSTRAQLGRSAYLHRIPGPLTDAMFYASPRASTRSRNYFRPDFVIPALAANWNPNPATRFSAQFSGVFGHRSSVQFVGFANVPDTIYTGTTGQFAARQVDVDRFKSLTAEFRLTREYEALGRAMILATGLALSNNDHHRRQLGTGSTGTDYDLTLTAPFRRDVHYRTKNVAAYLENDVRITPEWSVVPGMRVENGRTKMAGTLAYYDPADVPTTVDHRFPLFGIRSTYRWSGKTETYGGWSQAYRPMILQDLLPGSALEQTDPDMEDARGWTLEAGQRGVWRSFSYDVTAFMMRYDNRFGVLALSDANGPYQFRTNVGSTLTRGVEISLDAPLFAIGAFSARAFTATSYFDATYREGTVAVAGQNRSIEGNRVEAVPRWITRNGLQTSYGRVSLTTQVSHTTESFADAANTRTPTATGSVGLVPSYTIVDVNGSIRLVDRARLRAGVNNVFDAAYFTKRPSFYPGPGVWPSDGRAFQLSLDFDIDVLRGRQ